MPYCQPAGFAAVLAALLAPAAFAQAPADVRYGRDVRPLLSDRCFKCHGPDAGTRAADLRLDVRDDAVRARKGGAAIVPFDPAASLLWQRINAHDGDRMPPAASQKPMLNAAERDVIAAWILGGAAYEAHWSFVPPQPQAVPAGDAPHPVDRFLAATQRAHSLAASPLAAPATQARRAYLVLTGLPPTPDELAAFAADARPDAYERLVDRLLGDEPYRTRHAEHLAQVWLDAGRYADTSGIHMDAGRQAWAWRDWLIDALRDDLPFDRFVVEQLAGDLLPNATVAQRVATGFLRNHVTTDEGGAIDEEYRVEYAAERTATVGSVFLGLTLGCARCHDHKFDPIRQEDYFRLFAFFNSNQEPGLYSQIQDANRALEPFLQVPTPQQALDRDALRAELAAAEERVRQPSPEEQAAFDAFVAEFVPRAAIVAQPATVTAARSLHGATLAVEGDGAVHASGENPARDEHEITLITAAQTMRWLAVEALPRPDQPEGKVGRAPNGNAVLQHVRLQVRPAGIDAPWTDVPFAHALADVEQSDGDYAVANLLDDDDRGWAVGAHQGGSRPARALLVTATPVGDGEPSELRVVLKYDTRFAQHVFGTVRLRIGSCAPELLARLPLTTSGFDVAGPFASDDGGDLYATRHGPESAGAIDRAQTWGKLRWRFDARLQPGRAFDTLPKGRNVTYVGQRVYAATARTVQVGIGSDDGFQLFVDGALVAERRIDRPVAVDQDEASFALAAGATAVVLKVINTGGDGGFALSHRHGADELAGDLQLLAWPDALADDALRPRIVAAFREHRSPQHRERLARVATLQQELARLEAAIPRAMVMDEAKEPRPTFVLTRGDYDKPDPARPVTRELPAVFGALPEGAPRNRLGLAQWLVAKDNPLLLRVHANRLWEFVFGTGLVRTSEDFGLQGEWPSHPELLDWLALQLREHGLSSRRLLRLLVTSHAFRQDSRVAAAAAAIDRDNRWLAWFPRRRLAAEAIRDQALFVGGLLVERVGGPSVKPYQPPGLWQEVAMTQSNTRFYTQGKGDELWRRSLYTYWKRACPPPSLLTLDAPTREFCTIRRGTTNTPLQALVLWNDEQFVEAARGLAQRTLAAGGDDRARARAMFAACTGRDLGGDDLTLTLATLQSLRERFRATPADADALLRVGTAPSAAGEGAPELAAWTLLANALLALDATLWID